MFSGKDTGLFILRIGMAVLLILHGINKLKHGIVFVKESLVAHGLPEFIAYGVYLGEIVAPLLIILGYKTRLSAAVVFINMLMAIYLVKMGDIGSLQATGAWSLETPFLFLLISLVLVFTGGGKYALTKGKFGD